MEGRIRIRLPPRFSGVSTRLTLEGEQGGLGPWGVAGAGELVRSSAPQATVLSLCSGAVQGRHGAIRKQQGSPGPGSVGLSREQ